MWKKLNSPIVVALMSIIGVSVVLNIGKSRLPTELLAVYEELNAIVKDGASDSEKTKAIHMFAAKISSQLKNGFSAGWQGESKNRGINANKLFTETKSDIVINGITYYEQTRSNKKHSLYYTKQLNAVH